MIVHTGWHELCTTGRAIRLRVPVLPVCLHTCTQTRTQTHSPPRCDRIKSNPSTLGNGWFPRHVTHCSGYRSFYNKPPPNWGAYFSHGSAIWAGFCRDNCSLRHSAGKTDRARDPPARCHTHVADKSVLAVSGKAKGFGSFTCRLLLRAAETPSQHGSRILRVTGSDKWWGEKPASPVKPRPASLTSALFHWPSHHKSIQIPEERMWMPPPEGSSVDPFSASIIYHTHRAPLVPTGPTPQAVCQRQWGILYSLTGVPCLSACFLSKYTFQEQSSTTTSTALAFPVSIITKYL